MSTLERELVHYGYALIFGGTLVEGDSTVLTAAFLAHRGYFRLEMVMLWAGLATFLANQAFYAIARHHGRETLEKKLAGTPRLQRVILWVESRSVLLLLASRFLFGFRIAIPAACGALGMPPLRFFLVNLLGAAIWVITFGYAGYYGSRTLAGLVENVRQNEWYIAVAIFILIAGFVSWRTHFREPREVFLTLRDPQAFTGHSVETLLHPEEQGRNSLARWQAHDLAGERRT